MNNLNDYQHIEGLVENYLQKHFQISLDDIREWYGYRLCNFITHLRGERFQFLDIPCSKTVEIVTAEINNSTEYDFNDIDFQPGDIVIDIGANVGMVSIYLAKKYPFLKIYAFEPEYLNFTNFVKNIKQNEIPEGTITPIRKALSADNTPVTLDFCPYNTGGSQVFTKKREGCIIKKENIDVETITIDQIFENFNIEKVKLLKIDCEGAEHEALKKCQKKHLKKIEHLRGEFHEDVRNKSEHSNSDLIKYCEKYIPNIKVVNGITA